MNHLIHVCSDEQGTEKNIWTKEGKVIGGWSIVHNEELHNLY
jgi:hypothetical protein